MTQTNLHTYRAIAELTQMAKAWGERLINLQRNAEVTLFGHATRAALQRAEGLCPSVGAIALRSPIRVAGAVGNAVLPRRSRRGDAFATGQVEPNH